MRIKVVKSLNKTESYSKLEYFMNINKLFTLCYC